MEFKIEPSAESRKASHDGERATRRFARRNAGQRRHGPSCRSQRFRRGSDDALAVLGTEMPNPIGVVLAKHSALMAPRHVHRPWHCRRGWQSRAPASAHPAPCSLSLSKGTRHARRSLRAGPRPWSAGAGALQKASRDGLVPMPCSCRLRAHYQPAARSLRPHRMTVCASRVSRRPPNVRWHLAHPAALWCVWWQRSAPPYGGCRVPESLPRGSVKQFGRVGDGAPRSGRSLGGGRRIWLASAHFAHVPRIACM